jgi:hypothetical protein
VQSVVAQLEVERLEVDRLERVAAEERDAAAAAAAARDAAAKLAAVERAEMMSELRALRAATGIGDDGEELDPEAGAAEAAAVADMSGRDASALTARLVKATKAADAAKRIAAELEEYKRVAAVRSERIEELEQQALDAEAKSRFKKTMAELKAMNAEGDNFKLSPRDGRAKADLAGYGPESADRLAVLLGEHRPLAPPAWRRCGCQRAGQPLGATLRDGPGRACGGTWLVGGRLGFGLAGAPARASRLLRC